MKHTSPLPRERLKKSPIRGHKIKGVQNVNALQQLLARIAQVQRDRADRHPLSGFAYGPGQGQARQERAVTVDKDLASKHPLHGLYAGGPSATPEQLEAQRKDRGRPVHPLSEFDLFKASEAATRAAATVTKSQPHARHPLSGFRGGPVVKVPEVSGRIKALADVLKTTRGTISPNQIDQILSMLGVEDDQKESTRAMLEEMLSDVGKGMVNVAKSERDLSTWQQREAYERSCGLV